MCVCVCVCVCVCCFLGLIGKELHKAIQIVIILR